MRCGVLLATVFGLGALLAFPAGVHASWILTVSDGTVPGTVTFTGGSSPPTGSEFVVEGPAASPDSTYLYTLALTDGQTASQATLSQIDISITNLTGANLPITVTLEENNFTLPGTTGSNVLVTSSFSGTGPTGGSGTFTTVFNATAMPTQAIAFPGGSTESEAFTRGSSYSVTQTTETTLTAGQTLQALGSDVITVPEPSTACLALATLVGTGGFGWVKRRGIGRRVA